MGEQAGRPAGDARRVFGTTAVIVAVVGVLGAGAWLLLNWDYVEFRIYCSQYRGGSSWYSSLRGNAGGSLLSIHDNGHFRRNHKEMKESYVIRLLGSPRIEKGKSGDGCVDVQAWLEHLGIEPNGSEQVLVYNSDDGPPDHFIGDETENIFILTRDGKAVAYDGLFP